MKHTIFSLILFFISTSTFATRKEILLNENWMFRFSHQVQFKSEERVNLPHTWNSGDALSGKQDYYRGMGNYTKTLFVKPEWKGKRLFLRFEGVNTIANVFINDVHIGEHRGGYGAFVFEITDKVKYDADNRILVKVNNALQQDVMPLVGDFNFYGGIYRDVNLIITDPVNISLTDYASPGVYLIQNKVTKEQAEVKAKVLVSNGSAKVQPVKVDIKIWEDDKLVQQQDIKVTVDANHKAHPEYKIAISEYGAGASIYHQQDSVKRGIASGWWHPENYQTYYHIGNWKALAERPFVWGSFIWNLFDFGAAHRVEGDRPGINDKGLVTFDRKVKKDAFYFYKANWNTEEPFVYITNRRHRDRSLAVTDIMIFSNQPEVELFVNGKSLGRQKPDEYATFEWKGVALQDGENTIEARSTQKKNPVNDKVVWTVK